MTVPALELIRDDELKRVPDNLQRIREWATKVIAAIGAGGGGSGGPHAASHQNGGGDEISVAGLSGLLADPQTPTSHAASHQNGGGDEINVAGLSGVLAEGQLAAALQTATGVVVVAAAAAPSAGQALVAIDATNASWQSAPAPGAHAETHENTGVDEIDVTGLSGLLADAQTPLAHVHSGADITTGTVAAARLGSGSGGAIKYLREDSTWQAVTLGIVSAPYDTGPLTIKTETYFLMTRHLKLTGTTRIAVEGTATLRIT